MGCRAQDTNESWQRFTKIAVLTELGLCSGIGLAGVPGGRHFRWVSAETRLRLGLLPNVNVCEMLPLYSNPGCMRKR